MNKENIKTFQDACNALGIGSPEALPELLQPQLADIVPSHIKALLKLEIIANALNDGWQWIPDGRTRGWWPWFWFYTKREVETMTDEDKARINLKDARNITNGFAGVGFALTFCAWSNSGAYIGSRLACKSEEIAYYFGTQFIDIWMEYLMIPIVAR